MLNIEEKSPLLPELCIVEGTIQLFNINDYLIKKSKICRNSEVFYWGMLGLDYTYYNQLLSHPEGNGFQVSHHGMIA